MKRNLAAILALLLVTACKTAGTAPETPKAALEGDLPARIASLKPRAQDFFYEPRTELERSLYETGLLHHWQYYQKGEKPDPERFKGYILLSDPYHRGLKRISFLLGSDCSNFVHRFYQMIGANFRYMKTRHWIHLGRAKIQEKTEEASRRKKTDYYAVQNRGNTPIDLKRCEWDELMAQYELLTEDAPAQLGDVVVYPKSEGVLGTKGHMGMVSQIEPLLILQSKYPVGIVELPLDSGESFRLRWRGKLSAVEPGNISDLLARNYPEYVESCVKEAPKVVRNEE